MPATPQSFIIDPQGVTLAIDVHTATGGTAVAYSTRNGSTPMTLPVTISTATEFFFASGQSSRELSGTSYVVSAKFGSVEVAGERSVTAIVEAHNWQPATWTVVLGDGSIELANLLGDTGGGGGDVSTAVILAPDSSTRNVVQSTGDFIELVLKAFAGQTAAILLIEDENGDVKWVANQDGTGQLPIGKFTPNGYGPGQPTLFDPASTNWYDGLFAAFGFQGGISGALTWGIGPGTHAPYTGGSGQAFLQADAVPTGGDGSITAGGSVGTIANADDSTQYCEAYEAADIAHDGTHWRAQVLVDGFEPGFARLDYTQDLAQVAVRARTGQTDPLLDLKNESGTTVCSVDPVLGLGLSHLFSRDADAVVGVGEHRWYAERDITITHTLTSAGDGPTGADLIFDLMLDGATSIYSTTANRPKVAAGTNVLDQPAPDSPIIPAGHYITVDTIQVGSTNAGSKIDLRIFYR